MHNLKVFVVAPSDVKEERETVVEVCKDINSVNKKVKLEPILWEFNPLRVHNNPQENINKHLYNSDIYIVILWKRIGTIVDGLEGAITKSKSVTGTQFEIEYLLANKKEHTYFYFKDKEKLYISSELKEGLQQEEMLKDFLNTINLAPGTTKHSYQTFKDIKEFKKLLTSHLVKIAKEITKEHIKSPPNYDIIKSKPKDIQSDYYVVLYITLIVGAVILFLYAKEYSTLSIKINNFLYIFSFSVIFLHIPAIKSLNIKDDYSYKFSLKEITIKLAKRASLILFLALLLSLVLYMSLTPLIEDLVNFLKQK